LIKKYKSIKLDLILEYTTKPVIWGGLGWVVPPNNVELLTKAINLALFDSATMHNSRSIASIKRISENYNIRSIVSQYEDVYLSSRSQEAWL
jgi:glycosyltransferase involved in cell wall biosynthesis